MNFINDNNHFPFDDAVSCIAPGTYYYRRITTDAETGGTTASNAVTIIVKAGTTIWITIRRLPVTR